MRSVSLIRCLTKMSPSSSTSTGSQIATWRRSFTTSATISDHCWRERCSSDHRRFSLNSVQHDILPHRQSQLSDLTIRLHITTSLKSISQKRWLYHHNVWMCLYQFNFLNVPHVTNRSSSSLVNSLQLIYFVSSRRVVAAAVPDEWRNESCVAFL